MKAQFFICGADVDGGRLGFFSNTNMTS